MDRIERTQISLQTGGCMEQKENEKQNAEFQQITQRFLYGDVAHHRTLSETQRALIVLVALTACQTWPSIGKYTEAALRAGAAPEEIEEAIIQCTPYVGMERVRCALDEVNCVFRAKGIRLPMENQGTVTEQTRLEKGLEVQRQIFGKESIDAMRASAPQELQHIQAYLSAYCFGDFYTRKALDLKMRELITFCAICCLGGCEPQAKAHAEGNLRIGNTREMMIQAVTQCLPFIGFPRALNAIACIDQVTLP